jgi:hypothetical protein
VEIPYGVIWFKSKDESLQTTLELDLKLKDSENNLVWEHKETFEIQIKEDQLSDRYKEKHKVEIPFVIEKNLDKLFQGQNMLYAELINKTGDEKLKKFVEFSVKPKS